MTLSMRPTTLISRIWDDLDAKGEHGGARRVDDIHPADLYASLDAEGRPGLVLVSDRRPPHPPTLSELEISVAPRKDDRYTLGIWLRAVELRAPFALLCQDLVDESREVDPEHAAGFLLSRIARWRRLLKGSASMSLAEVRGLLGELIVLRECLKVRSAAEVVEGWLGPFDAAQDFDIEGVRIEVKAIQPDARTLSVTSADQLDADGKLYLAVVTLVTTLSDSDGSTLEGVAEDIRRRLRGSGEYGALALFESKLAAGGYFPHDKSTTPVFRVEELRVYAVRAGFPLIKRADLPDGVAEIRYDVEIGALRPFSAELDFA
jgi:hypothetical protein